LSGTNLYAGDTTNRQGALNPGTTSPTPFGVGGTLRLEGGIIITSGGRTNLPIQNPIVMSADTIFEGTTSGTGYRDFPIDGPITTVAGTLTLKNNGTATGIWNTRLHAGGLNFTRPIVIGVSGDTGQVQLSSMNTNGAGDQTFSGQLSGYGTFYRWNNTAAPGSGGRTILTASNTYSGGTIVSDGTLLVNNPTGSGTGTGTVTVHSQGVLGGTGTIGGAVVVTNGGSIGAGTSVGTLTLTNGLSLSAGGTNIWELAANSTSNPGANYDQISLTGGNLVLGGTSRLLVKFIGTATFPDETNAFWQEPRSWKIISRSGSAANPGATTFATIDGTNGCTAGRFSTSADTSGNVYLNFALVGRVATNQPYIYPNLVGAGTTNVQLSWISEVGANYTVQFNTNLTKTNWIEITNLVATSTNTTIMDKISSVSRERYYRVVSKE
jgi:autotransporter-associated beta strand protein